MASKRSRNRQRHQQRPSLEVGEGSGQDLVSPNIGPDALVISGISSVSGVSPGGIGISPLLFDPAASTPLENGEPGGVIPPAPLWAMRDRMHFYRPLEPEEQGRIASCLGNGDSTVYVVDDGRDHCMIGRRVGQSPDGCVYCLVARISLHRFEQLREGEVAVDEAFSDARDICLCGVFENQRASNVIVVQHYKSADSVPNEYVPPGPFLQFSDPQMDEG